MDDKPPVRPTTKRLARIAGLGLGVVAVAGALLWVLLSEPRGPLINGRPVSYWTRQPHFPDPDSIGILASDKGAAIPALIKQLSLPDLAASDFAKRLWRRLPAPLRPWVPEPTTRAELRAGAAFGLRMIFWERYSTPSLSEAQMVLPALTNALHDGDVNVRVRAADAFGSLEVISAQAVEACEVALKDPHWSVRNSAVLALSDLSRSDQRAIPPMRSALSDPHPLVRKHAADLVDIRWFPRRRRDAPPDATEAK